MADPAGVLSAVLDRERLRIVASLIRAIGDWELAEDAVSDAAERALRHWPRDGVPANPAAWLTTTARNRAVDVLRRRAVEAGKLAEVAMVDVDSRLAEPIEDDRLRLIFTCCHPALALDARVALTLKVVCGLPTVAVARAFLVSEPTMSRRLLRAKQRIAHAGIPYRVPAVSALPERLDGVLAVIYLVFTTGWAGDTDESLAEEAIRLGRLLVSLLPADESAALLALMLLQHSRRDARVVDGSLITLEEQDRARWSPSLVAEGLDLLAAPADRGSYRLQAELAAVHARAASAAETDWSAIVALYDELLASTPSPVVELNRAVAVGMASGAAAGLAAVESLDGELAGYPPFHAARGEFLARTGRSAEARAAFERAADLAPSAGERDQLRRRITELD